MFSYNLILGRLRRFWQVQSGLANLANQRLIAHAHQMFPLAKVALKAFTTREMRIVSLIDEEDVTERILRHLGLWQKVGACIRNRPAGRNDPRSVARRPPSPTTTPNRSWRSRIYRCPSRLIC